MFHANSVLGAFSQIILLLQFHYYLDTKFDPNKVNFLDKGKDNYQELKI